MADEPTGDWQACLIPPCDVATACPYGSQQFRRRDGKAPSWNRNWKGNAPESSLAHPAEVVSPSNLTEEPKRRFGHQIFRQHNVLTPESADRLHNLQQISEIGRP